MLKLYALFDARYQAVGVESYRMAPTRAAIAVALALVAGFCVGWGFAALWVGALFVFEGWNTLTTRLMAKGPVSRSTMWAYFWSSNFAVPTWSALGLVLWIGPSTAFALAAVAFWCGQLLYASNFCSKSPLSVAQAGIPSALAPLLIPLLLPRFHGMDQVVVVVMLALCVGNAVMAAFDNMATARKLNLATDDLVAGKEAAEAAKLEMAVAKADADAANEAKSAFLATMSHEIRTPLNGVLGMTQAMAMDRLSRAQRERLGVVWESGEALLRILNDILDLSKIEAGKLELESIEYDLGDVVRGACQAFTALAAKKGLSIRIDIADAEGAYLGDPTRVRQILYNLVSNALKFTDEGEVAIRAEAADGRLRLEVSDTGEGIAPSKLSFLFAKFTQADASTARRFGGTGLGLSICQQLAELMGGTIDVASREGVGTTFTVTLDAPRVGDAKPAAATVTPDRLAAPTRARGLRVLAAEDNQVNQLVLKTLLKHAGVEPVVVENGALALEAWEQEPWDLILMDVSMPVMDGPTAVRLIREREAKVGRPRTPIIALTANAMGHQIAEYLAAGMDGHVAKPIEAAKLFEALGAALDKSDAVAVRSDAA